MAHTVSLRQGARELGVALSTLQHHIKKGHVTLIDKKVDVEIARMQLAKHTDVEQSMRGKQNPGSGTDPDQENTPAGSPLWQAKEATERVRNELLKLELAQKRGELVKASDLEAAMAQKLTGAREAFLSLPDRLAPVLAAESDPIKVHELMTREIRAAMRSLAAEAAPLDS